MLKTTLAIVLTMIDAGALAQTSNAPLSLDLAQKRARFARDPMVTAERKVQAAEKKEKAAQKRYR